MCLCYILFSNKLNRYYTGFTTLSVDQRLENHLTNYYDNKFTSKTKDWIVFFGNKMS
jgi:putative endonuclease